MTAHPEFNPEKINETLRCAREKDRGYASYWKWEIDRDLEEVQVARVLLTYLEQKTDWSVTSLRKCEIDPPDCAATLADGRVVGIEVTELVDERFVKRHAMRRSAERAGREPHPKAAEPDDSALWTTEVLREEVKGIVERKDVTARGDRLDEYILAICTDEMAITLETLQEAIAPLNLTTKYLDGAYVLLSYHPATETDYPGGIPVIKLPVLRDITA